jgi:eukaryotic-like serine/threonine-protein kinase
VALKVLPEVFARDSERMARFEREAPVLASLNHPNIAAIYGLEESEGTRATVMELVEGPTLRGPLPLDEALPLAHQIAEALEYAHERGIVHRDLKPANIKVASDGVVKVLDFGLAKALEDAPAEGSMHDSPTLRLAGTRAAVILGAAAYMSPEQARGMTADRRADVWAFGVVLYEMLTGPAGVHRPDCFRHAGGCAEDGPGLVGAASRNAALIRRSLRRFLERDRKKRLQAIGEARIAIDWPSYAPIGYLNNRETSLIEVDPKKAPAVAKLFELNATGS